MFTGIVDHCGTLLQIEHASIWIQSDFTSLELGESIAVDGICLTVTKSEKKTFCCDISPETANVTTACDFKVGQSVNLERALTLSSRLGGHMVMGHIDQTACVESIRASEDCVEMRIINLHSSNQRFLFQKGSIAVNGVSLTINNVFQNGFSVMLIPHTLERTNLKLVNEKQRVNIEIDMMARMVGEQLKRYTHDCNHIH